LDVQLWHYDQAPAEIRQMAPEADSWSWFALIHPEASEQIAAFLSSLWRAAGYSVTRHAIGIEAVLLTVRRGPPR
jgi:hypothetical protein